MVPGAGLEPAPARSCHRGILIHLLLYAYSILLSCMPLSKLIIKVCIRLS